MAINYNTLTNPSAQSLALALAQGENFVAITTLYNHRQLTHESIQMEPVAEHVARTTMWLLGVKPRIWAEVHKIHHSITDANLLPTKETADYLVWRQDHSAPQHPEIPRIFKGLDPGADLRPAQILKLGQLAETLVAGRYDRPKDYSISEAQRLLDPKTPRYFYPTKTERRDNKLNNRSDSEPANRSLNKLAVELRDPHSPVLHNNGVRGILRDNVSLYRFAASYMEQLEKAGKNFGQDNWDRLIYDKVKLGVTVFYAGNIAVAYVQQPDSSPKGLLKAAARGSLVAISADGIVIAGGNITNSLGHAGELTSLAQTLFTNEIAMKADGSYTTNDKRLSLPFLDEVGGQEVHHGSPDKINYTRASGRKSFEEAPFGSSIKVLVKNNILMKPGNQYGANKDTPPDGLLSKRPDVLNETVLLMQKFRVETSKQ